VLLQRLGCGFLTANPPLRSAIAAHRVAVDAFWDELVRLVLQLCVVAIAEHRDLLIRRTASGQRRRWYAQHYALVALRQPGHTSEHPDSGGLWRARRLVLDELARRHGALLARRDHEGVGLRDRALRNADLRAAATLLLDLPGLTGWGVQELGAVREALLELAPAIEDGTFTVRRVPATRRMASGVYYTPPPLADFMAQFALDPVIDQLCQAGDPAELLRIQAVDPACGAGVFLVAAAHHLARRYAALLADTPDPSPQAVRFALPVVMQACIYGIDIDPVAVDLAKAALWLEVAPDRTHPMSFLDANVICANTLEGPDGLPAALRPGSREARVTPLRQPPQGQWPTLGSPIFPTATLGPVTHTGRAPRPAGRAAGRPQ